MGDAELAQSEVRTLPRRIAGTARAERQRAFSRNSRSTSPAGISQPAWLVTIDARRMRPAAIQRRMVFSLTRKRSATSRTVSRGSSTVAATVTQRAL